MLFQRSHKHIFDSLFVLNLVLLKSGDVELNPGPRQPKCPCGSCDRAVTWNSHGIQCDGCDRWFHTRCIGMESKEYQELRNSSTVWLCNRCGLPNISRALSHQEIPLTNSFESLSSSKASEHPSLRGTQGSPSSTLKDRPIHTSTPKQKTSRGNIRPTRKPLRSSLKVLNVNCQSLPAKRETFQCLTRQHSPDIIVGTESWLTDKHTNNECFPTNHYNVFRRDRGGEAHGGGVFIAAKNDLILRREDSLETNCEVLWCSLELASSKTLLIGAYYRPHENDADSLAELELSLTRVSMNHTILLAGDFNLPGWKWAEKAVADCSYPVLHRHFGEMLDDKGLTQLIEEPTRQENTLYLVMITNNPTLFTEISVVPGISDHDCPLVHINTRISKRRPVPP